MLFLRECRVIYTCTLFKHIFKQLPSCGWEERVKGVEVISRKCRIICILVSKKECRWWGCSDDIRGMYQFTNFFGFYHLHSPEKYKGKGEGGGIDDDIDEHNGTLVLTKT